MEIPGDCRFTREHEWAKLEGGRVRVGVSDYAQQELGDVVFVDLPEVGSSVEAGAALANVESVKAVSDIYAPLSGTIVEVNAALADAPEQVNQQPYGGGWMVVIEPADAAALDALMDAEAYRQYLEELGS